MTDNKENKRRKAQPTVAVGLHDAKFGEKASKEEIKEGKSTKVTRVYLDENDPS